MFKGLLQFEKKFGLNTIHIHTNPSYFPDFCDPILHKAMMTGVKDDTKSSYDWTFVLRYVSPCRFLQ